MPESLLNAIILSILVRYLCAGQTKLKDSLINDATTSFRYTSMTATVLKRKQSGNSTTDEAVESTDIADQRNPSTFDSGGRVVRHETDEKTSTVENFPMKQVSQADSSKHTTRIPTSDKTFKCDDCGRCFNRPNILKTHQRIHTGEKPFVCDECGECFIRLNALNNHQRAHRNVKPFVCSKCRKCFNHVCSLKRHEKIHTDVKPFKCDECGKCFNRLSNLQTHQRIHTGEKLFKCAKCKKCFRQSGHLKIHKETHSDDQPFLCPDCGKCFARVIQLERHQRAHTCKKPCLCLTSEKGCTNSCSQNICCKRNEISYECHVCKKRFPDFKQLKTHVEIYKKIKPIETNFALDSHKQIDRLSIDPRTERAITNRIPPVQSQQSQMKITDTEVNIDCIMFYAGL